MASTVRGRTRTDQIADNGGRFQQVLAVVQHHESMLPGEDALQSSLGRLPLEGRDAQFLRDRTRNVLWLRSRPQANEPGAIRQFGFQFTRRLESQTRLAHATGPKEGDQPDVSAAQ